MSSGRIERRARTLSGLPPQVDFTRPWWKRLVSNPWSWIVLTLIAGYGLALWRMYAMTSNSIASEVEAVTKKMDSPTTVTQSQLNEAFLGSTKCALLTLVAYLVIFFLLDRLRPTKIVMKVLALGWGCSVATLISMYVNSWVGTLISIEGPVDSSAASRAAIFVAPFVEEAAKATILFLLAMALRYRFVTVFQSITLAGLSAVGFAFTENILYYSRTFIYSAKIVGTDPDEARLNLVWLRGFATSWGHPLFTTATAIGLIVALRARPKFVRIVAPLAGYLFAVLGHMGFNGLASVNASMTSMVILGLTLLVLLLFWLIKKLRAERVLMRSRLDDFVQMGWIQPRDSVVFTRLSSRTKLAFAGLLRGPRVFLDTIRLQRSITELAYLRSMMTLGTVDASGDERSAELLAAIRLQRVNGLSEPDGLKLKPDTWQLSRIPFVRRLRLRKAQQISFAPPPPVVSGRTPVRAGSIWATPDSVK